MLGDDRGPGARMAGRPSLTVDVHVDLTRVRWPRAVPRTGSLGNSLSPAHENGSDPFGAENASNASAVRLVPFEPHPVTSLNVASV